MLFGFCCGVMGWLFGVCWSVRLIGCCCGVSCCVFIIVWKCVVRFVVGVLLLVWLVSSLFWWKWLVCCVRCVSDCWMG